MKVLLHRNFSKGYAKLPLKIRQQFKKRLAIFLRDPFHTLLHNHALQGERGTVRSINVTSDLRALYHVVAVEVVEFLIIDTHSNLYG